MEKIKSSDILGLTPNELGGLITEKIKEGFNRTDTSPTDLRCGIYDYLNFEVFDNNIKLYCGLRTCGGFDFHVNGLTISYKIAVKNTKKIVKLTKLKSAYLKEFNKVTFDDVTIQTNEKHFDFEDKEKLKLKNDGSYIGSTIRIDNFDEPFSQINYDFLYQEYTNMLKDENDKTIEKNIKNTMAQPLIKGVVLQMGWGKSSWTFEDMKPYIPEAFHKYIPSEIKDGDELFEILEDIMYNANKDIYDDFINNLFGEIKK